MFSEKKYKISGLKTSMKIGC